MPLFMISYDVPTGGDYQPLYDILGRWDAKPLALSLWLVEIDATAGQVQSYLTLHVGPDIRFVVTEFAFGAEWAVAPGSYPINSGALELLRRRTP